MEKETEKKITKIIASGGNNSEKKNKEESPSDVVPRIEVKEKADPGSASW